MIWSFAFGRQYRQEENFAVENVEQEQFFWKFSSALLFLWVWALRNRSGCSCSRWNSLSHCTTCRAISIFEVVTHVFDCDQIPTQLRVSAITLWSVIAAIIKKETTWVTFLKRLTLSHEKKVIRTGLIQMTILDEEAFWRREKELKQRRNLMSEQIHTKSLPFTHSFPIALWKTRLWRCWWQGKLYNEIENFIGYKNIHFCFSNRMPREIIVRMKTFRKTACSCSTFSIAKFSSCRYCLPKANTCVVDNSQKPFL